MDDFMVTITVTGDGTAAAVSVLDVDSDQIIAEANDLDGLDEAIAWLRRWAHPNTVKVTRRRAGLYVADVNGRVFTIEHRWDIDGSWWLTEDDAFHDPHRGAFRTKREALESLRLIAEIPCAARDRRIG